MLYRFNSKHLVINGCGIVPKKDKLFPVWLKTLSYCSVRDNVSANYVCKYRKTENCGDLYWGNNKHYIHSRHGNKCLICLANPFGVEEKKSEHYKARYDKFLSDCCEIIREIKKKGYDIDYLPFYVHSDIMLFADLQERLGSKDKVLQRGRDYDILQVDELFSQYDLGFCMRFHSILLSLKNTLPMIAICYDYKSKAMLEEAGLSDFGVDYGIRASQFFGKEFDLDVSMLKRILERCTAEVERYSSLCDRFYTQKHAQVLANYTRIFNL